MAAGGGLCPAKTVIFLGAKTHRVGQHGRIAGTAKCLLIAGSSPLKGESNIG
jgi:hypothetical protein